MFIMKIKTNNKPYLRIKRVVFLS